MLEIYDTAGQEEFSSLRDTYIKAAEGFLLVYSVTSVRTFSHAQKLLTHIQKMKFQSVPVIICGNKADMDDSREVTTEEGQSFASGVGCPFFETSAKTGINVHEAIHQLVRLVTQQRATISPATGGAKPKTGGCVLL